MALNTDAYYSHSILDKVPMVFSRMQWSFKLQIQAHAHAPTYTIVNLSRFLLWVFESNLTRQKDALLCSIARIPDQLIDQTHINYSALHSSHADNAPAEIFRHFPELFHSMEYTRSCHSCISVASWLNYCIIGRVYDAVNFLN